MQTAHSSYFGLTLGLIDVEQHIPDQQVKLYMHTSFFLQGGKTEARESWGGGEGTV